MVELLGEDKKVRNERIRLLLFFIYPFAAFILALNSLKSKFSFIIIFLFFVLFGLTFIAQNKSADSYHYVEDFNSYKKVSTSQYINDLKAFFTFQSNIKDIYTISSYYLVSRITANYHILMALWAIVFSFFFLKAFRFFVDRPEFKKSLVVSLLAFLFIYSNNIFNINGVRFYTAAWIAVYAIFEIVVNKNYKFVFLALITPLIHISYVSLVGVLLIYVLTIKYDKFWAILFFISFFMSEISIVLIQNTNQFLPLALQNMVWDYTEGSNLLKRMDSFNTLPLYAKILTSLPRYYINFLMFVLIFNSKYIKSLPEARYVYVFLLIWLSFTNFAIAIPSFGARFITIAIPLITYICLLCYSKISSLPKLIYLIPFVFSYQILYWFRDIITVTDPFLIISLFPHLLIKNLLSI